MLTTLISPANRYSHYRIKMEGCVNLPFAENKLEDLIHYMKDYALCHGFVLRTNETPTSCERVTYPPFMLLPSPVPRHCFTQAQNVMQDFNLLMHRVAHDYHFLQACLNSAIKVDGFTRKMWSIYETVREEGIAQPVCLALNRSDYMFDCEASPEERINEKISVSETKLRQIEFNTMASSFGGLGTQLTRCHRMVLQELAVPDIDKKLPQNQASVELAKGFIRAWETYGCKKAALLFLVFPDERNVYDQKWLEFQIKHLEPGIRVIRRSIPDIADRARLTENKQLEIDGLEVAVVYMRSGYAPKDYRNEKDWNGRMLVERSRAIKCPNIYYHLAGTKKVQQVLATPGAVERFVDDPQAVARIRATFAGQYSLDQGTEGDKTIEMAMQAPERYVLKPQREGGGNNHFGDEIREVLSDVKDNADRSAYVLMDRIYPTPMKNYALRSDCDPVYGTMVSELGIFGVLVGTEKELYVNKQGGYILRSKTLGTEEGGVAAGFAALDSPYLIDS